MEDMDKTRLPLGIISERDIEAAEEWVIQNVGDQDVREIFGKMILHGRKYLYHSQIPVEESDCALVLRPWGNEIYITDRQGTAADEARLKLAVAVRALASEEEDPGLWKYITDFSEDQAPCQPDQPDFQLVLGGKR